MTHLNPQAHVNPMASLKKHVLPLPPQLEKYISSAGDDPYVKVFMCPQNPSAQLLDTSYITVQAMENHIKELQVWISLHMLKYKM